ncbi:peptide MFS transporter [Kribbella sp. CA-293567]|uniref:peptide MFS transporter n=1 Tax=Kribbella sp. CA-293567 TaxID=3002436 RepID=UPI0022DE4FA4|nr:oligopeptide:H+ symporter [Kribbella sp. CA-293567]WBQ02873.1 oligopeptide:H+ symporter [Kribbella sp. CA-293567]
MSGTQQQAVGEKQFFGHPRGLMTLFTTELWERFSYYGMRAILLLYLTDQAHGLGLGQSLGEAVVSIYGASVYLLSVLGGWFADRVVGARRTVLYGGSVIVAGHLALAIPADGLAYAGIALVALGTGLLKPNVSTMVGNLYEKDDTRRDSAFSIFYMGINIGSFSAPFVVGFLRREFGFHVAFAAAAVGMTLALIAYVLGRRTLQGRGDTPPNPLTAEDRPAMVKITVAVLAVLAVVFALSAWASGGIGPKPVVDAISYLCFLAPIAYFTMLLRSPLVTPVERRRVRAYIPLFIAAMLFFMVFEQAATTLTTFAAQRTELSVFGVGITPEFFASVNPFSIIVLAPVFAVIWIRLGDRGPSIGQKFATGLLLAGLSFAVMALASSVAGEALASPLWLVVVYVIQTLGELFLSPVGLAATTLLAPKAFNSQMMALWFLAPAAGQAITAQLVQATEGASDTSYFGGLAIVTVAFAVVLYFLAPWIRRHADARD